MARKQKEPPKEPNPSPAGQRPPGSSQVEWEHCELRRALRTLADAAENLASSEPDMPSHRGTVEEFDDALDVAREVLAATKHDPPPPTG